MTRCLLAVCVFFGATSASAEDRWTYLFQDLRGTRHYVDERDFSAEGERSKLTLLYDFSAPRELGAMSSVSRVEMDCPGHRYRYLYQKLFTEAGGRGQVLWESTGVHTAWQDIPVGTVAPQIWKLGCEVTRK